MQTTTTAPMAIRGHAEEGGCDGGAGVRRGADGGVGATGDGKGVGATSTRGDTGGSLCVDGAWSGAASGSVGVEPALIASSTARSIASADAKRCAGSLFVAR